MSSLGYVPTWADVLEEHAAQLPTAQRLVGQLRACEISALAFCRLLERWARGDAYPSTPGERQSALRRAADRIETALTGTFEFTLRKDLDWRMPRAETPEYLITFGLDWDLDTAVQQALRTMLDWMATLLGLSRQDAYHLSSLVCDLHVTQTVNNVKGIHAMVDKRVVGLA